MPGLIEMNLQAVNYFEIGSRLPKLLNLLPTLTPPLLQRGFTLKQKTVLMYTATKNIMDANIYNDLFCS
jgi:hypothetical protein